MNGTVLLILLGVVVIGALVALVPLGRRIWRLVRTGRRVQRELVPLAAGSPSGPDSRQEAAALATRART